MLTNEKIAYRTKQLQIARDLPDIAWVIFEYVRDTRFFGAYLDRVCKHH